jgi:hypothetical protein
LVGTDPAADHVIDTNGSGQERAVMRPPYRKTQVVVDALHELFNVRFSDMNLSVTRARFATLT